MIMVNRLIYFVGLFVLLCLSSIAHAEVLSEGDLEKYLKNENRAVVGGGKFIDYGEYDHANQLLSRAIILFPENSMLAALYGKSLYFTGNKDLSETYLMDALSFNPENRMAQSFIEHIRRVRTLTESEEAQEWDSIMKDKIGDLIVFVLSIWLGTSFNSIWRYFLRKWRWHQAKRSYVQQDYDDVVRILESHVIEMEQESINKCLQFMLSKNHDVDTVGKVLTEFVVREEDLKVLLRSLELLETKQT